MNLRYLGDALDHWKGALLSHLVNEGQLTNLGVYPMATDAADWLPEDYALYAKLLRVPESAIVREPVRLGSRNRGFPNMHSVGDVFLDPDTGIATGRVANRGQYATALDVCSFLSNGMNRVVAVYQHIRAKHTRERVACILRTFPSPVFWSSYESGTVAMLFFSFADWRCDEVAVSMRRLLGRHATNRVFSGSCAER